MWKKAAEMSVREAIGVVAGPREWGDTRESWLARAARNTGTVSVRMMRSLWSGEIHNDSHWAAREVRRCAADIKSRKEARQAALDLAATYEGIAEGMNATDSDFHSEDIAALVHAARVLRGLDRAGDQRE